MSLLNEEQYPIEFASGGSGANSMIGIAQLGGKTAFSGKIGGDNHGKIYRDKLEENGVSSFLGEGNGNTGSCLVLVTDDGSRTMNTHLGISQDLQVNDINPGIIEVSKFLYLTGYLWDTESQKKFRSRNFRSNQSMDNVSRGNHRVAPATLQLHVSRNPRRNFRTWGHAQ